MKTTTTLIIIITTMTLLTTQTTQAKQQWMTDRPGELIQLAEQLTNKIQEAENTRDQITKNIEERSQKLREINQQIKEPGQSRADKLELMATRNQLETEENQYRKQALTVVKDQMNNIFTSLAEMKDKLTDIKNEEPIVDRAAIKKINRYFAVSAQLIRGVAATGKGPDPKTLSMLETLEKNLIVTRKSTDFVEKALTKIVEYQKVVALYNARLSYLETGLSKHRETLSHQRDGITISVSLGAAQRFMDGLDIKGIEDTIMTGLSTDPSTYFTESTTEKRSVKMPGPKMNRLLQRYSEGRTIKN
jgi:chromosome segregation ATPase